MQAIVGHFMLEYTHPFYDGNGRLGRFLLAFRLLDVLSAPTAMSLSHQFSVQRAKYYSAFQQAEQSLNRGEVTFFVKAIADLIGDAQLELEESLDEKRVQLLNLEGRIGGAEFSDYQKAFCRFLGRRFCSVPMSRCPCRRLGNTWANTGILCDQLHANLSPRVSCGRFLRNHCPLN